MTLRQVRETLHRHSLTYCDRQLYRILKRINLRPVGIRQCPQRWPIDTAQRILDALGYDVHEAAAAAVVSEVAPQLVSMAKLKAIKKGKA